MTAGGAGAKTQALLELRHLTRRYPLPRRTPWGEPKALTALDGVSLQVHSGRSLGVVGESGSGKSTLARLAMALEAPTSGQVLWQGRDVAAMARAEQRQARRDIQMVFQDPYGSLDPRQRIERIVCEPLSMLEHLDQAEHRRRAAEALDHVGLRPDALDKYPHEFSGGQRQRIAMARAIIARPRLIVADEPVSALDVSVQAQVLNLMRDLADEYGITYLLISHDLAVVGHVCQEVAVMQHGRVVEQGPPAQIFQAPEHPYTRSLVAAVLQV